MQLYSSVEVYGSNSLPTYFYELIMKHLGSIIVAAVFMLFQISDAGSQTQTQTQTGIFTIQIQNNGIVSTFDCYVPEDYDSTRSYQLFYGWHGAGMPAYVMRDMLYVGFAQSLDAIVVCPDANNVTTNIQLLNLVNASLEFAELGYNIKQGESIITGFSWGGRIAYELGLMNPSSFKGIIGLAPAIGVGNFTQPMWDNLGKIRMATIIGDKDYLFTSTDAAMNEIHARGGELLYLVKPGIEHIDSGYVNSPEFIEDYWKCYSFIMGTTSCDDLPMALVPEISTFPSPVYDYLSIEIDAIGQQENWGEIVALNGAVVHRFSGNSEYIDAKGWQSGLYFVRVNVGENVFYQKLLKLK
jgi:Secretion system C-terminal sorting domain